MVDICRGLCITLVCLLLTLPLTPSNGSSWIREPDWLVQSQGSSKLLTRHPRFLVFNNAGIIKLIFSFVIPIEIRKRTLVWTTNLQFQYFTPVNYTELFPVTYKSKRSKNDFRSLRAIDRNAMYEVIRNILERQGFDGRACILRAICQIAETPISHNGLVGEIMHVLFTPDTSTSSRSRWRRGAPERRSEESLGEDFFMAQLEGETKRRRTEASRRFRRSAAGVNGATSDADVCRDGFPSCPSSILDMVSILLEL